MNFDLLPEDCFAHILSLTSPRDACRAALVSVTVQSMADSDSVWLEFLPSDYRDILSRLVSPLIYSSNKELYLRLCNPCLIDGGNKIFSIEKFTSKKGYTLCARELSITWASHPLYWSWKLLSQSRFAEVAELITIWWLEICGTMSTNMLSPKTTYIVYLIVKFADRAHGLDFLPSQLSIEVGKDIKSEAQVYLNPKKPFGNACLSNNWTIRPRLVEEDAGIICERDDGWVEIELGRFFNDGSEDKEVRFSLKEVKGHHLKGGLIVEGVEIRPTLV